MTQGHRRAPVVAAWLMVLAAAAPAAAAGVNAPSAAATADGRVSVPGPQPATAQPATAQPHSARPQLVRGAASRTLVPSDPQLLRAADGSDLRGVSDVSGSVVVGTRDGHGWAYDLAAPQPRVIEFAPPAGEVAGVMIDDGLIAGSWVETDGYHRHAFLFDLRSPAPAFTDLGPLGTITYTYPTDIDGGVIVGVAEGGYDHGFFYDTGAATPQMVDLRPPHGSDTRAEAISGNLVVGSVHGTAAVADLTESAPQLRTVLNPDRFYSSSANQIEGQLVAGELQVKNGGFTVPFYLDLAAHNPKAMLLRDRYCDNGPRTDGRYVVCNDRVMNSLTVVDTTTSPDMQRVFANDDLFDDLVDVQAGRALLGGLVLDLTDPFLGGIRLPLPSGARNVAGVAVDGPIIVGNAARSRAAAWTLAPATRGVVTMTAPEQTVTEASTAVLRLRRVGPVDRAATVSYEMGRFGRTPLPAFAPARGRVHFTKGQRTAQIQVPVAQDRVAEGDQFTDVTLTRARGADLGGRVTDTLRVAASDVVTDLAVQRKWGKGPVVGRGVVSGSTTHQTLHVQARRGQELDFFLKPWLQAASGAHGTPSQVLGTFRLSRLLGALDVRIYEADDDSDWDHADQMRTRQGWESYVVASAGYDSWLRPIMTVARDARVGTELATTISVSGPGMPLDRVRIVVHVVG